MPIPVTAGARDRGRQDFRKYLDEDNLPTRGGVYLVTEPAYQDEIQEIDVYYHWVKGLCCFKDDFGSGGTEENDKYDDHVSVQCTGLDFIMWLGNSSRRRGLT